MVKIQFRESDSARKVVGVKFSTGSSEFIRQSSHIQVTNDRLYEEGNWIPAKCGPLDPRLGTSTNHGQCRTCHGNIASCVGHFGYISLAFPVFHVGYFKLTIQVLQCICKNCACLLLSENQRSHFLRQITNPNLTYPQRKALQKSIVAACQKTNFCPRCGQKIGWCRSPQSIERRIAEVVSTSSTLRNSSIMPPSLLDIND